MIQCCRTNPIDVDKEMIAIHFGMSHWHCNVSIRNLHFVYWIHLDLLLVRLPNTDFCEGPGIFGRIIVCCVFEFFEGSRWIIHRVPLRHPWGIWEIQNGRKNNCYSIELINIKENSESWKFSKWHAHLWNLLHVFSELLSLCIHRNSKWLLGWG